MKRVLFFLASLLLAEGSRRFIRDVLDDEYDQLSSMLSDFDVLQLSGLEQHSVRKRDVQLHTHAERLLSFTALQRRMARRRRLRSKEKTSSLVMSLER